MSWGLLVWGGRHPLFTYITREPAKEATETPREEMRLFFGSLTSRSFREGDKAKMTTIQSSPTAPSQEKQKIFLLSDETKMIFPVKRQKQVISKVFYTGLHGGALVLEEN